MMKNMRGIVDPYTLGFLLALLGTLVVGPTIHNDNTSNISQTQVIKSVDDHDSKKIL